MLQEINIKKKCYEECPNTVKDKKVNKIAEESENQVLLKGGSYHPTENSTEKAQQVAVKSRSS